MKPISTLSLLDARTISSRLCADRGVDLLLPYGAGTLRREAILRGLALVHGLTGAAWDLETARRSVSVTLPGLGLGTTDVLRLIPSVYGVDIGSILAGVFSPLERTSIMPCPAIWGAIDDASTGGDPAGLLATIAHELEHVSQLARSGAALWSLAYGAVPGLRAWGEAQGYAQSLAGAVLLRGVPVSDAYDAALSSLAGYGLDVEALVVAADVLRPAVAALEAGGVPSGPICDVLTALRAAGYDAREP